MRLHRWHNSAETSAVRRWRRLRKPKGRKPKLELLVDSTWKRRARRSLCPLLWTLLLFWRKLYRWSTPKVRMTDRTFKERNVRLVFFWWSEMFSLKTRRIRCIHLNRFVFSLHDVDVLVSFVSRRRGFAGEWVVSSYLVKDEILEIRNWLLKETPSYWNKGCY